MQLCISPLDAIDVLPLLQCCLQHWQGRLCCIYLQEHRRLYECHSRCALAAHNVCTCMCRACSSKTPGQTLALGFNCAANRACGLQLGLLADVHMSSGCHPGVPFVAVLLQCGFVASTYKCNTGALYSFDATASLVIPSWRCPLGKHRCTYCHRLTTDIGLFNVVLNVWLYV
jgi:hypothetical protein